MNIQKMYAHAYCWEGEAIAAWSQRNEREYRTTVKQTNASRANLAGRRAREEMYTDVSNARSKFG